ncbi:SDR family NAD(P)-dependent oxidoreductase [Piscinibacter sakaiensis]|uniref:SDR family NAD(P)-dependent oxidoreductase n=1 Tax=Piscinibacter sakaiensis TaxID=1547922 RepID=UPI003AAC1281
MQQQLTDRVVILTGAEGIVGQAVLAELAARGALVAMVDRAPAGSPAAATAAAMRLNGIDLGDPAAASGMVERVVKKLGRIDGLVNVAGGFAWEPAASGSIETWDRMYQINLRTVVVTTQAVLPKMLEHGSGRIVNVGAAAALQAGKGMAAYAASKSGVARLTEGLAEELKDQGINVNAVLPTIIDTPTNRKDMPDDDPARWVGPDKLAAVIAFLLSDDASAITGALLPVRGRV